MLPLLILFFNIKKVNRVWQVINLFESSNIEQNFRSMFKIFPAHRVGRGNGPVFEFKRKPGSLPESFTYDGKRLNLKKFLEEKQTTGFIVIKDDAIIFEEYYRGYSADSLCISWSMGKSIVSALVGLALEEGYITSIEDPVTKYLPELKRSAYRGVSVKNILQMSSGVRFNEDYADFYSDINRMGRVLALGNSMNEFVKGFNDTGTNTRYI